MPHGFYYSKPYPGSTLPYQGESPLRPPDAAGPSWAEVAALIGGQLGRGSGPPGRGFDLGWPSVVPPRAVGTGPCDALRAAYDALSSPFVATSGRMLPRDSGRQGAYDPGNPGIPDPGPTSYVFKALAPAGVLLLTAIMLRCPWAISEGTAAAHAPGKGTACADWPAWALAILGACDAVP